MSPDLRKLEDRTDNLEIVKKTFDRPEMEIDKYNQIPFNNKITFEKGIKCRLFGTSFNVGQLAIYYVCDTYNDNPTNFILRRHEVWLVDNKS